MTTEGFFDTDLNEGNVAKERRCDARIAYNHVIQNYENGWHERSFAWFDKQERRVPLDSVTNAHEQFAHLSCDIRRKLKGGFVALQFKQRSADIHGVTDRDQHVRDGTTFEAGNDGQFYGHDQKLRLLLLMRWWLCQEAV